MGSILLAKQGFKGRGKNWTEKLNRDLIHWDSIQHWFDLYQPDRII